jgi:hypothetical protein
MDTLVEGTVVRSKETGEIVGEVLTHEEGGRISVEIRYADGFPPPIAERDLTGVTDAQAWAQQFVQIARSNPSIPLDEGSMIGWFANAIEAGRDAGARVT